MASSRRCVCVRPTGQTAWGETTVAGLFNPGSILNSQIEVIVLHFID